MGKNLGDIMFGSDASEWPAWLGDVIAIIAGEELQVDDARMQDSLRK